MLRIAGRSKSGVAKPFETDENGVQSINFTKSTSMELANSEKTLVVGESTSGIAKANDVLSKTVYVHAEKDGYAGIDVKLNDKWLPILKARDEVLRDDFVGDNIPIGTKWGVAKLGSYNTDLTYSKIMGDKLELGLRSNSGTSHIYVTSTKKIATTTEKIIAFVIDETQYPVGINSELNLGFTPTMPVDGGSNHIAGRTFELRIREGKLIDIDTSEEHMLDTLDANAKYTIISTPSNKKVYRNGILIFNIDRPLDQSDYHFYFQLTALTSASTRAVHVDNLVVWERNEDAKVAGGELWVKTSSDAMPSEMRVVFQNEFTENNHVTLMIVGQP